MSDQIICSQCQAHNPLGSKFCNNCGLPLHSTTIRRCPTCQKDNPITNYYCDHCGTRLIFEERATTKERQEPQESSDLTLKPFSLPTRETESLADLNPDDMLDWLNDSQPQASSAQDPDDVPDWMNEIAVDRTGILSIPETGLLQTIDFDGTDELAHDDFADLLELGSATDSLPDWLADIPVVEAKVEPTDETEAIDTITSPPSLSDADSPDPGNVDADGLVEPAEELLRSYWEGNVSIDSQVDWLSALETNDLEPLPETPELDNSLPTAETADSEEADDWEFTPIQTESSLPDWLHELQQPSSEDKVWEVLETPEGEDLVTNDNLPAWVREMRPNETGSLESNLPSATGPLEDQAGTKNLEPFDDLADLPDLGESELPDWLEGIPTPPPIYVEPKTADSAPDPSPETDQDEVPDAYESLEDLTAALAAAPPPIDPTDDLVHETLPDWIKALNPTDPQFETQDALQRQGPLAGVRGVVDIEPIVATPREARIQISEFAVTTEQQQQAKLLQQIVRLQATPTKVAQATDAIILPRQLRLVLALLLLAGIFIGVLGPNFLPTQPAAVAPHVTSAHTLIEAAANKTVLIAFDYTPATAGELNMFADTLGNQLETQGSHAVTLSLSAAGTALANSNMPNSEQLGFLPGNAIGLRQLRDCFEQACALFVNNPTSPDAGTTLTDVSLIIILTSEQEHVVGWAEQVATNTVEPVVIVTTQALQPFASRYIDSRQFAAMMSGLSDLVHYQEAAGISTSEQVTAIAQAQAIAQLIVLVSLVIGGVAYGFGLGGKRS